MKHGVMTLFLAFAGFVLLNVAAYFFFVSFWPHRVGVSYTAIFAFVSGVIFYVTLAATKALESRGTKIVSGATSAVVMLSFITGLAYSISTGFAGFWGGLPFWCIAVSVLAMVVYDFYDECIRRKNNP